MQGIAHGMGHHISPYHAGCRRIQIPGCRTYRISAYRPHRMYRVSDPYVPPGIMGRTVAQSGTESVRDCFQEWRSAKAYLRMTSPIRILTPWRVHDCRTRRGISTWRQSLTGVNGVVRTPTSGAAESTLASSNGHRLTAGTLLCFMLQHRQTPVASSPVRPRLGLFSLAVGHGPLMGCGGASHRQQHIQNPLVDEAHILTFSARRAEVVRPDAHRTVRWPTCYAPRATRWLRAATPVAGRRSGRGR